jgi:hypothetical protein
MPKDRSAHPKRGRRADGEYEMVVKRRSNDLEADWQRLKTQRNRQGRETEHIDGSY